MRINQSLHNHTTFDDGRHSPAEMAASALELGLSGLGLTAHSPMDGEFWTVKPERMAEYCAQLHRLRDEYAGRLNVWCGLEFDMTSDRKWLDGFDYVIASVHADSRRGAGERLGRAARLFGRMILLGGRPGQVTEIIDLKREG